MTSAMEDSAPNDDAGSSPESPNIESRIRSTEILKTCETSENVQSTSSSNPRENRTLSDSDDEENSGWVHPVISTRNAEGEIDRCFSLIHSHAGSSPTTASLVFSRSLTDDDGAETGQAPSGPSSVDFAAIVSAGGGTANTDQERFAQVPTLLIPVRKTHDVAADMKDVLHQNSSVEQKREEVHLVDRANMTKLNECIQMQQTNAISELSLRRLEAPKVMQQDAGDSLVTDVENHLLDMPVDVKDIDTFDGDVAGEGEIQEENSLASEPGTTPGNHHADDAPSNTASNICLSNLELENLNAGQDLESCREEQSTIIALSHTIALESGNSRRTTVLPPALRDRSYQEIMGQSEINCPVALASTITRELPNRDRTVVIPRANDFYRRLADCMQREKVQNLEKRNTDPADHCRGDHYPLPTASAAQQTAGIVKETASTDDSSHLLRSATNFLPTRQLIAQPEEDAEEEAADFHPLGQDEVLSENSVQQASRLPMQQPEPVEHMEECPGCSNPATNEHECHAAAVRAFNDSGPK